MKMHSQPQRFLECMHDMQWFLFLEKSWLKIEIAVTAETPIQGKLVKVGFWIFNITAKTGSVKQILSIKQILS